MATMSRDFRGFRLNSGGLKHGGVFLPIQACLVWPESIAERRPVNTVLGILCTVVNKDRPK
jgi:hypothetical protein